MQNLHFKTHNECVAYIEKYARESEFIENHTRKDLAYILSIIESHQLKQSPYAFRSMCKKRMLEHILFYMKVHENYRGRVKRLMERI